MAIAFLSQATNDSGATSSITVTITINAGDTVVVVIVERLGTVTSVTDTGGSSYTQKATATLTVQTEVWATLSALASTSVTVNLTAGTIVNVVVLTYSGVSAFGVTATNTATGTSPTVSLTTQDANNYEVAGFGFVGNPGTGTIVSGTFRLNTSATNQASAYVASVDNTAAAPQAITCSFTTTTSTDWAAAALELRGPVAAGAETAFVGPVFRSRMREW